MTPHRTAIILIASTVPVRCCVLVAELQGVARIWEALQAHQWPGLRRKTPPAVGRALHAAEAQQPRSQHPDGHRDSISAPRESAGAAVYEPADDGFLNGSDVLAFREFLSSHNAADDALPLDEEDDREQRFDQLMTALAGRSRCVDARTVGSYGGSVALPRLTSVTCADALAV